MFLYTPPARIVSTLLLWLLFALEVLFLTFWRKSLGPYWSPVLLYGVEWLLCLLLAQRLLGFRLQLPKSTSQIGYRFLAGAGIVASSLLITGPVVRKILNRLTGSDIVPALQIYVQRFLQHEVVYRPIAVFDYTFLPNYPPMHWLPFVGAEFMGVDYRWWAYCGLLLGLLTYEWVLARFNLPWAEWLVKAILPLLIVHFHVLVDRTMYGFTVEALMVGFYCLLATGIFSNSAWVKAAGLICCLLSRFSLALWVPFYGLLLLYENPRRGGLTTALTMLGVVVLFVPFLLHDPTIFFRAQLENLDVAKAAWQQIDAQAPWLRPIHLFNGVGVAPWFYDLPGTLEERIIRLQMIHFFMCAGVVALAGWLFWRYRRCFDTKFAALLSLKVYLATFYAFLIVPYAYLASVSLFTTLFVILLITKRQTAFLVPYN